MPQVTGGSIVTPTYTLSGKTMVAERMATILPPLTLQESLETTRIYSSVGLLAKNTALIATRPVCSPISKMPKPSSRPTSRKPSAIAASTEALNTHPADIVQITLSLLFSTDLQVLRTMA